MAQGLEDSRSQVMISVDPHKASWTAAAVDASLRPLATIFGPGRRRGLPIANGDSPGNGRTPTGRSRAQPVWVRR